MNKDIWFGLAIFALFGMLFATVTVKNKVDEIAVLESKLALQAEKSSPEWLFNHQREVWLANLEWCESHGIPSAVNPKDNDGTPSFGAFQFKPATFRGYSKKYGLTGSLMDYESQKAIMLRMLDDKDVRWENEFPACIRKLGLPPVRF